MTELQQANVKKTLCKQLGN